MPMRTGRVLWYTGENETGEGSGWIMGGRCLCLSLALLLALAGCGPAASQPAPAATPTAAPTPSPTPLPTPSPAPGLDYDEIRTPVSYACDPSAPCEGYFTMSRDGLWGLLRADGTEVLPCRATTPVSRCGAGDHWIWSPEEGMDWDAFDALSASLTEAGDGALCPGHGGYSMGFFYNLDTPGLDRYAVDTRGVACYIMATPGDVVEMEEKYWDSYGDPIPVYNAHLDGDGGMSWPAAPTEEPYSYWYMSREGWGLYPLLDGEQLKPTQAGWFFDQALAPVEKDGVWGYLDRNGNVCTGMVYDPVCDAVREPTNGGWTDTPARAACLQNGYAAVCRQGKWGLLGADGTEVIPCEKAGVAWEGTRLWVKEENGWVPAEL